MKELNHVVKNSWRQALSYLKDYRFSSILVKYFLLLFICLMMPMAILSIWYGCKLKENMQEEMIKLNDAALEQAFDSVDAIIQSMENLTFSLSISEPVQALAVKQNVKGEASVYLDNLRSTLTLILRANEYIESACVYFSKSEVVVSDLSVCYLGEYDDLEGLEKYSRFMPKRTVLWSRKIKNKYPYVLSILFPINASYSGNEGAVVINVNVEALGEYIGSGEYRNKDYSPMLLVLDSELSTLIYSDEYRLLKEGMNALQELRQEYDWQASGAQLCDIWGHRYAVSGLQTEEDGFWYIYLSSLDQFDGQNRETDRLLVNSIILSSAICLVIASMLAIWVYKPVRRTIHVLDNVSMLTQWDKKEHLDEIEMIQRSILSAKKVQDDLNEQIRERMVSLHNAQICALQNQINPHFLYNTLEAIGNAAALLVKQDNKVTKAIYTLGRLMRISLSSENYLVPIEEELEHVRLYVELMEFRFRGRIEMHVEIPENLYQEKIVKLTLQPLIENAIEHGLGRKRTRGCIRIQGERRNENIYLYVIDNGQGIPEGKLKELQDKLRVSAISDSKHIGLRNVNQRLKLVFGEACGLSVSQVKEGGTKVTICLRCL